MAILVIKGVNKNYFEQLINCCVPLNFTTPPLIQPYGDITVNHVVIVGMISRQQENKNRNTVVNITDVGKYKRHVIII